MSDKNDDKKNENDPYDFFKLQLDNDDNDFDPKNNKPKKGFPFFGIFLTVAAVLFVFNLLFSTGSNELIDFSEFRNLVEQGQIVRVELGDRYFTGYTADANANIEQQKKIGFLRPLNNPQPAGIYRTSGVLMQSFIQLLDEKGVEYKFIERQNNVLLQILVNIAVPVLLIFLVYFFIFKKMGGGMSGSMFGIGGGRSKAIDEGNVKTRFSDVAGVDEAKDELVEVVDFLKEPKKYTEIGGKIPKGVLLVGPPGTGKTLLARAVAGEAGVPFFRISGSDFVEMFVGVGASRVRDLFRSAREKAPCIIFIDEIDAIGKSRVSNFGGSNDEREQTLNQLLVEMDGFDNEKGLIILAATNRADVLDPALLRPGRFDRQVPVEKPDVKGREEILRIHAKNVKLDDSVDFESVAHGTTGFAGADLANVVNEAALLAVRNGHTKVTMSDMNDAIDKVSIGLKKKSRKDNEKDMRLVSIHETGHALVGAFTPDYPPVNKITVVPRSHGVGGFTQYREEEEKHFQTKKDILAEIDTLLGGRAAEEVVLGDVSTGASNDIARATEIVKHMIVDFGMSEKFRNMTLGKGVLGNAGGEPTLVREFSEDTQKYIDSEIARILNERYDYVLKLLTLHKELLENIAGVLKEKETIEGKEFLELVKAEKPVEVKAETKTARTRKTAGTKTTAAKKTSAKKAE